MDRNTLLGALVVCGCTLLVAVRVATAPAAAEARVATAAERIDIARTVAAAEPGWTKETSQNFVADAWSQRDDFHGREYRQVLDIAKESKVRIEDVLRAIDDDIHQPVGRSNTSVIVRGGSGGHDRHANAVACKPRPFYD